MNCPVCGQPLAGNSCAACGYDQSRDYGAYPTLAPLTGNPPTVSRRKRERAGLLLCSKCGSPDFRFRFSDRNFSCPRCGHLLTPQELDTVLSVMGCPPLHHQSTPTPPPKSKPCITAVAAGYDHTVVLYSDGTVGAIGRNQHAQCDVESWSGITAIAAGAYCTIGLRTDGRVVFTGYERYCGGCDTWTDITAISVGQHTLGLTKTGTVRAAGSNGAGQCRTDFWWNIAQVATGAMHSVGLKKGGSVLMAGYTGEGLSGCTRWNGITAIAAGSYFTAGLKADGTVVIAGGGTPLAQAVKTWSGITAICAASNLCIGLRFDGTVLTAGQNLSRSCDPSGWTGIRSISVNYYHAVGLRTDGTLVATGDNEYGQCDVRRLQP